MIPQNHLLIESYYPATFRERGVAVPFTTLLLAGTRIRASPRVGIELLVPNPSGARGVYILQWPTVREHYRPTMHDTVLLQRVTNPGTLDPRAMRDLAWDVAREGLAGPEARAAAEANEISDRSQRVLVVFLLLRALVEQLGPPGPRLTAAADRAAELDRRGSQVLHRLAPGFGRTGPQLGAALTALGDVLAPAGITSDDPPSRVARLIDRLQATRNDMVKSFQVNEENDGIRLGRSVTASMDTTLACAKGLLRVSRASAADPLALLKRWIAAPRQVAALATRTEWVLDGWERISLLWQSARDHAARRGALLEMAQLVPVLPREAIEWTGAALPVEALEPTCRVTCLSDGWRSGGAAFVQVGRNEKLRAMSL